MARSTFIAARNSRHRTAALALYRALIRTASRIPLAENAPKHPIVKIVRKRFSKNTAYTSYRLIYAAMAAGYKFLNLLTKAQTPNSPEHSQVLNHLQSVRNTAALSRTKPHPKQYKPTPPPEPLLINVAKENEPPKYTSNILPRPIESLKGPRKVPSVSATAEGQPFVRLRKPQPHTLSRMIGRKGRIFSNRIENIMDADERLTPEAALEDEWDRMMDDLLAKEGAKGGKRRKQASYDWDAENNAKMETFAWSVQLSRLWWEWKVEKTWEDWIARGEALQKLVEQERSMAEREEGQSNAAAGRNQRTPRRNPLDPDDSPPNVGLSNVQSLTLMDIARDIEPPPDSKQVQDGEAYDPFLSPSWHALVKAQERRMLKWTGRQAERGD
ncbi:hypothetical protein BBK36DRAFT_163523 [Trichoderma citrinoviride]|uniref:Complex 1 LYR protein domain-containing protein n=1 Tax=Trichoderma citrinoviride TaxID=58853 RepID=A0A2T4B8G0_9HYPO|nr:hypothetical protein BBK36DRAFT_163523 [Trichoderma citrinoviride]PTB65612.1 hypothetical protein BBK36DRAFT_163523 [Trichoderma citrinoviride]